MGFRLWFVGAFVTSLLVAWWRYSPPAPATKDAAASEFSAARALDVLERILGPETPHPTATPSNRLVRDRVVAELASLGLEPTIQREYICGGFSICTYVENIVARIGEPGPAKSALLLTAHYDSVPAGPGAGDDGSGTAVVIEVARALLAQERAFEHAVVILISDGEELGLLGAKVFARHPYWSEVGLVINVEARGTDGPSYLFETGPANAWIIGHYAASAPRPSASSAHYTVYKLLPNDTDFSIYQDRGVDGANFGFIGTLPRYHTPRDSLEYLDHGSLQHQGENMLGLARSLATSSWSDRRDGEAVYFDFLSWFVVSWPIAAAIPVTVVALLLVVAAGVRMRRLGRVTVGEAAAGSGLFLLALASAIVVSLGLEKTLELATGHPAPWTGFPPVFVAMHWAAVFAVLSGLAYGLRRRVPAHALWLGTWLSWAVIGVVVAATLPGFSHLFAVPALAAGAAGLIHAKRVESAAIAPAVVAWLMWLPVSFGLVSAVGLVIAPVAAFPGVLCASVALAVVADSKWPAIAAAALALTLLVVCALSPRATESRPQGVNLVAYQEDDGPAGVYAFGLPVDIAFRKPPLPEALARQTKPSSGSPFPWFWEPQATAEIPRFDASAPKVEVLGRDEGGTHHVRVEATRGGWGLRVSIHGSGYITGAQLADGTTVPLTGSHRQGEWRTVTFLDPGGPVQLTVDDTDELWVVETSSGLPAEAEGLSSARGDAAVPFWGGDYTATGRRVRLP